MLRAFIYGLTILHLGPGIAFALLAFGCDGATPYLGAFCGQGAFSSFALLTAVGWLLLSLGLAAVHLIHRERSAVSPRTGVRVLALLTLVSAGALLGASGAWLTGSQYWYFAIPASLVAGWLFLANPLACQPGHQDGSNGTPGHSDAV